MRVLLDTSVLIAAMVVTHPAHQRAFVWLQRVSRGPDRGLVAAHSLAELYTNLTRPTAGLSIEPQNAYQLIKSNIIDVLEVVVLSEADYMATIEHLANLGIIGAATYDALILQAAINKHVD